MEMSLGIDDGEKIWIFLLFFFQVPCVSHPLLSRGFFSVLNKLLLKTLLQTDFKSTFSKTHHKLLKFFKI